MLVINRKFINIDWELLISCPGEYTNIMSTAQNTKKKRKTKNNKNHPTLSKLLKWICKEGQFGVFNGFA